MLNEVRKTVEKYAMLTRDEHLLVAVSGGPESVENLREIYLITTE